VGSSLTVFLWMWLKRIFVIWIQNLWQDDQIGNIYTCPERNHIYCVI
jgi:hypothetical protein